MKAGSFYSRQGVLKAFGKFWEGGRRGEMEFDDEAGDSPTKSSHKRSPHDRSQVPKNKRLPVFKRQNA